MASTNRPKAASPDQRQRYLRWLRHGATLARDFHGVGARPAQAIWCLLIEALETMARVPDQEKRWLSSGTRSGGWGMAGGMTRAELEEIERLRILSAMSPFEEGAKVSPQRDAVERAVDVLDWLRFTSKDDDHRLMKAAVHLAQGREGLAGLALGKGAGSRTRQVAYEIRTQTVGRILRGLRETAGIVPAAAGLRFHEITDVA